MQIVEKLGSNLREIRQRTLKTLIFKLKTSKITTYDLLEPNLAIKLLTLLAAKEDTEIDLDILQIFEYFIKEARGRQLLNTFGFEILRDYSYKNPGNGKALDILRAISIPKDSEIAWQQPDKLEELEQSNNLTGLPDRVSEMLLHDQQELENRRKISLPSFKVNAARLLMFEVVTPQPQEEEQLLSWVNLLSGIPMSEKIELDLFHEICSKIGAQIFLQRSGLLYKVLEGFESNSQLR